MTAIPQATAIDGYRWLKNDIIRGVYQPDEKLRMSLLTSRYGLGVGPLREALSQLVAERLVTVVNQKGYRVAPMSEQELLDIFAARARSGEGKLQVELAQLKYLLPRLGGKGTSMSRLGGGIGTRGPGETKLESDRRHIRRSTAESESGRDSCCCRNRRIHSHNYSRSFLRCYHIRNRSW